MHLRQEGLASNGKNDAIEVTRVNALLHSLSRDTGFVTSVKFGTGKYPGALDW